jgi:hypothetical protein
MNSVEWLRTSVVVLLGSVLIGGCSQESAAAAPAPKDNTITSHVKTALREDPRVVESEITVSTDNGIVKLAGQV